MNSPWNGTCPSVTASGNNFMHRTDARSMNWPAALMASVVFCMMILAAPAIAADGESDAPTKFTDDDGFTYTIWAPGEAVLTKYTEPDDPPSQVRIPESVMFDGAPWTVVAIDDFAFGSDSCGEMTKSIFIPRTVTDIGNWAFSSICIEDLGRQRQRFVLERGRCALGN